MRAGELFQVLTRNSFDRLEVTFDERDAMHLTGVRPSGEVVAVPGLSTGTEDQLFLALRISAVEDYLERATALPFGKHPPKAAGVFNLILSSGWLGAERSACDLAYAA